MKTCADCMRLQAENDDLKAQLSISAMACLEWEQLYNAVVKTLRSLIASIDKYNERDAERLQAWTK